MGSLSNSCFIGVFRKNNSSVLLFLWIQNIYIPFDSPLNVLSKVFWVQFDLMKCWTGNRKSITKLLLEKVAPFLGPVSKSPITHSNQLMQKSNTQQSIALKVLYQTSFESNSIRTDLRSQNATTSPSQQTTRRTQRPLSVQLASKQFNQPPRTQKQSFRAFQAPNEHHEVIKLNWNLALYRSIQWTRWMQFKWSITVTWRW